MRNVRKNVGIGLWASTFLIAANCSTSRPDSPTPPTVNGDMSMTSSSDMSMTSSGDMSMTSSSDMSMTRSWSKPNILFVLTDDLSWNLVEQMPLEQLPAIKRLMARGMTFTRYFVTDSLCCPSRSSIFTGKYPHDTQVFTNDGPHGGYATFERVGNQNETFATALNNVAGYQHVGMMGKYLNGYQPTTNQKDPGWTGWDVAGDGYPEYDYDLNQNGVVNHYGHTSADYLTDVMSGLATNFVTAASNGPFMLEVASFAPHAPYVPPMRYLNTYTSPLPRVSSFNMPNTNPPQWLATYTKLSSDVVAKLDGDFDLRVEAVKGVDDMIGKLLDQLDATGLDKNTYVFFSSDNGYHMGEHQLLAGKQTAFDTDIRVPLVVIGPGIPGGVVNDQFVENIDLCPTFAELAGTPAPQHADGHSLVPLLNGQSVADWRNVVLIEHEGPNMPPPSAVGPNLALPSGVGPDDDYTMAGYAAVVPSNPVQPPSYLAIRMTHSVYVEYSDGETEYYDLTTDPDERNNTASALSGKQVKLFHSTIQDIASCHNAADCWAAQKMPAAP